MTPIRLTLTAVAACLIVACSSIDTETWEPDQFLQGNYDTYSWRSEPIRNTAGSADPIYKLDPIIRKDVDEALQAKGYERVKRNGSFSVDYLFAPGLVASAPSEQASNVSARAGVRPNTTVSQAERDNAIALGSSVRETRRVAIQLNDGSNGLEVWRGVITKFVEDVNRVDRDRLKQAVDEGINEILKQLPARGATGPS